VSLDPRRARVFGEVADLYNAYRPSYPDAMVDDVLASIDGPAKNVLDVGCGTGKAAQLFAGRGLRVTGIEPDPAMAGIARGNLAPFPDSSVVNEPFESWDPAGAQFDLVTCGQAWHWLDPDVRGARAHAVLRPGAALALFWNTARREESGLRDELDGVYAEHAPDLQRTSVLLGFNTRDASELRDLMALRDRFATVLARDYDWSVRYTTQEYVGLMQTHSDHRMVGAETLDRLLTAVTALLDAHGGGLEYAYRTTLHVARPI
jgi:SAM-dependent methyltransferase